MRFKKIYVEITNKCNLNCSFCSKDNRELKELNLEEFSIILQKIKPFTNTIYLHVKGEPLLHSKLEKILYLTKKYQINVKITTNGTLLREKYNILKKFDNIKQINISLHSENNKKNYFLDVFEISNLLSESIPIVYRIWTLNSLTLNKLSTKIVDKIINYYKLDNSFIEKVKIQKNIKIKKNIYLDKDNEFVWPESTEKNNNEFGSCLGTRSHIAILVNGDVVPCCLDSKGILKLGNIFDNNLDFILKNPLFININKGFSEQRLVCNLCRNCNYRVQKFKCNKKESKK